MVAYIPHTRFSSPNYQFQPRHIKIETLAVLPGFMAMMVRDPGTKGRRSWKQRRRCDRNFRDVTTDTRLGSCHIGQVSVMRIITIRSVSKTTLRCTPYDDLMHALTYRVVRLFSVPSGRRMIQASGCRNLGRALIANLDSGAYSFPCLEHWLQSVADVSKIWPSSDREGWG